MSRTGRQTSVDLDSTISRPVALIVEDNIDCVRVYETVLQGFTTHVAPDGQSALETLKTISRLDLLLLDLDMPVMNGLCFYNRFKKLYTHLQPKIILTSSHPWGADLTEALSFFAHAPKDTSINTLSSIVRSAMT